MTENEIYDPIDEEKRQTLRMLGLGITSGIITNRSLNLFDWIYLKLFEPDMTSKDSTPIAYRSEELEGVEILYGDNLKSSAVIPGDTNINLLASTNGKIGMSEYIRNAKNKAEDILQHISGIKKATYTNFKDLRIAFQRYENVLILGGPVANELTRIICKYDLKQTKTGRKVPFFQTGITKTRYGFYVGNEIGAGYYANEEILVLRPDIDLETGTRKLVKLPRYAIIDIKSDELIIPPVERYHGDGLSGDRLLWDMLMIIRVPNPINKSKESSITIIGGMHGYSTEAFFRDIHENMMKLRRAVENKKYFQLLVPAKIEKNCRVTIDWDGGQGSWTTLLTDLSPHKVDYL